jgi:hypothetical protein
VKKLRMRKFFLVHLNGERCQAPARGFGVKVASKRPKRAVKCEVGSPTVWRRAERVSE